MSSTTRRAVVPKTKRLAKADRKAPTNLSLRIDLVERAKSLGLNLSEVVEATLEDAITKAEQVRWLAENEKAIDYYNSFVEKHGLFGEEFREF
ncbi:MAG: type II toxin-antitoxin system CcdA family antitoxin [Kofleriaceae bacterium]